MRLLSLNGTKCKHCIMACLGITHNKQDTSIVALITYYELFIHSQQQTLDACFTNIIMSRFKLRSSWHFPVGLNSWSSFERLCINCRSKLKHYLWFWCQCTKSVIVSILSGLWALLLHLDVFGHFMVGPCLSPAARRPGPAVHPPRSRAKVNKKLEWNESGERESERCGHLI